MFSAVICMSLRRVRHLCNLLCLCIENEDSSAYATFSSTFTDTAFAVDRYGYREFAQFLLDRKFRTTKYIYATNLVNVAVKDRVHWLPLEMKIMQTIINYCVTSPDGIITLRLQASLTWGRLRAGDD